MVLRTWTPWLAVLGVIASTLAASVARAEPVVVVHVRRDGARADATVILRDSRGHPIGACTTEQSTCEIRGVAPGRHTVVARDELGNETPARTVVIPPEGKVSLFVAAPRRR